MGERVKAGRLAPAKAPARRDMSAKSPVVVRKAPPGADSRWQRTVRYGWDKGGSRGGR